uniref:Trafficking protein particle complex subunit n=1 Tax=Aureoumbra lagunensis TaxID=44058 RepID=A0A7S3K2E4_9STRA|mmetsp:Transcript_12301/g.16602  ORF Transcript_12301/g.16602 Transcript_12301/m.16602 type:complete len:190 (+) Transcript_12301:33-602(+)|eukprot:CAMPEP_0197308304 /NCGR_PEP_ID=MMETSP0891-20130614/6638_1 /TAXON_ID=44058 ORGANISM="Aureoumbra lagunensis, Strain CCMP1510" /NCGR_SAMPLE_ID=MMETSP0891 /ASSEMBLY_ACC=CAM_ASM_000534 /LENGTH=189 /DNA_ID=CAMNT_0042792599 /DNA_START=19 /DNA_END=588 /DNA_ORIENTATION=-
MSSLNYSAARLGDQMWTKMPKVNGELFALTYGAHVVQLMKDLEDVQLVNEKLDQMGYNIGTRLIDEFLAKSGTNSCGDFTETADKIAKIGFKMFLGITVEVANWNTDKTACSLLLYENPLTDFVEIPPSTDLFYSNVICGVIRGALEMVQIDSTCYFIRDTLRGDDVNEIRLEFKGYIKDEMSEEYTRE